MCLTEYDEEYTMGLFKKEYLEEGIERGIERGREQAYYEMVLDGDISEEKAASKLSLAIDVFKEAYEGWLKSRVSVV